MKVENGVLIIGNQHIELPLIHADALVRVWAVPSDYRENGFFVAVILPGQPDEIPACSLGDTQYLGELTYPAAEPNKLAAAKAARLLFINEACDLSLTALTSTYPAGELQSWPQQVQEATALLLDPSNATPLLSAIADARGLTAVELASRVQAKAEGYAKYSGAIIGKRQALEDQLDRAETLPDIEVIVW
ncbi:hypothetical protein OH710_06470 [Pseudomonas capsici]|uniref:hypothetical protein n=1 Tax=Pseudomonas capsici TaxID=2810614 RepID=UPI0021F22EB7|nr:hypothetical protein [Pseudomonas capsici]MCV4272282.1 hypothetical protein [Pseudomonas capsici]